jgi:anti-sigma B factor antagonist
MVENFTVSVTERERCAVVRVVGELDLATAPLLHDAVSLLLATSDASGIEFDLVGLSFCGSAGTRLFVQLGDAARDAGMSVTLLGVRPIVRRVFDLCGFGQYPDGLAVPIRVTAELVATG